MAMTPAEADTILSACFAPRVARSRLLGRATGRAARADANALVDAVDTGRGALSGQAPTAAAHTSTVIEGSAARGTFVPMTTVQQSTTFQRTVTGSEHPHRSTDGTFRSRLMALRRSKRDESRLQRICTANAQPGHLARPFRTSARYTPRLWWRTVRFRRTHTTGARTGPQERECTETVRPVKKSPPSRAHTLTLWGRWSSNALVGRLVDWKRAARACFDPSHRKGR